MENENQTSKIVKLSPTKTHYYIEGRALARDALPLFFITNLYEF